MSVVFAWLVKRVMYMELRMLYGWCPPLRPHIEHVARELEAWHE